MKIKKIPVLNWTVLIFVFATGSNAMISYAVNEIPVAVNDTYVVDSTVFTVESPGVLANDIAADGEGVLTVSLLATVSNGSLALTEDGSFTYISDEILNGIDSFLYLVSDSGGQSASACVYLEVTAPDTDKDGKPDGCETIDPVILTAPGSKATNRLLPDSDGDGLPDGLEGPLSCPMTVETTALTNPRAVDIDGDGIWDGIEVHLTRTDPLNANDPVDYEDLDGDGLPAVFDPDDNNPDADGDGYLDTYEVAHGFDAGKVEDVPSLGDVNNDGAVNNLDALLLFNYLLEKTTVSNIDRADILLDGEVNNIDVLILFHWTLGNIDVIPVLP